MRQSRLGKFRTFPRLPGQFPGFQIAAAALLSLVSASQAASGQGLRVANPLSIDRSEIVELPLAQIQQRLHLTSDKLSRLTVQDARSGRVIPSQLYSSAIGASPDTLLLLVQLKALQATELQFRIGPNAPAQKPLVFGRPVPERKDDFAWENEEVAFRIYGPALEATGEITSGIDVWSKRIPNLVVNSFYQRDHRSEVEHNPALSYHQDDGIGQDSYDVGPTRGCGGTGVWDGQKLYVSNNYTKVTILASGPIRFEFLVEYAPWKAAGRTVTETKRVTLDAGSHLNRIVSTYTFDGDAPLQLAAGIAVHPGAEIKVSAQTSTVSVWDTPQESFAGRIATGLLALPAQHAQALEAVHHGLLLFDRRSGEPFTYFAGAGWSKADMPAYSDWLTYLDRFLRLKEHPVELNWRSR